MTVTSCTTCPLHSHTPLYERCSYPRHEQHGFNLFTNCPLIRVGKIEIEYEKETSETQATKNPTRTGEWE